MTSTIFVPGASASLVFGKDLTSPPAQLGAPTSDPAWTAGTDSGDTIVLNNVNEAAGWGPNAGTALAVGRHRVTFVVTITSNGNGILTMRAANVTDNTVVATRTRQGLSNNETWTFVLDFDALSGKAYQPTIAWTQNSAGDTATVRSITEQALPALATNEHVRTDPTSRHAIDRLDSSGALSGYLSLEGSVPLVLQPGTNIVSFGAEEIPLALYEEPETKRQRVLSVTLTYTPRYPL